jgi:hypothetical protein
MTQKGYGKVYMKNFSALFSLYNKAVKQKKKGKRRWGRARYI